MILDQIKTLPITQIISAAIDYGRKENVAVAVWKHPQDESIHLIVDFSEENITTTDVYNSKASGFVFAPFNNKEGAFLIKADLYYELNSQQVTCKPGYENSTKTDEFLNFLHNHSSENVTESSIEVLQVSEDEGRFKQLVSLSVDSIRKGDFLKVVPSRKKEIKFDRPLNLGDNFSRLARAYPSAFVSLVFAPKAGIWMGATPELLISVKGDAFKSVALAGTQKFEEGTSLSNVAWTQKEIEEQALVSRYIINCFKKIRLREYEEIGPKTIVAGNLLHLKTEYKVDMKATNFPDLGETMLKLLHPTSAICGMPLEPAMQFLQDHELYNRKFFSGYLGPANFNGQTALYVNLRCMNIEDSKATLFAGAGVTEDSQPDKEWIETEIKMNTLLNIIK